jgi:hypothetical protein
MNEEKTPSVPCEMSEALIGYLYGELSSQEASAFEEHARTCAQCAHDLRDFMNVRRALAEWRIAPHPKPIFEEGVVWPSVRQAARGHPTRSRDRVGALRELWRALPAWGRAVCGMAAVLLLLALFNVQVEWAPGGGFRFRASLLPARTFEFAPSPATPALDRQQILALIEDRIRDAEERQQKVLAAQLEELAERLRREQQTTLTGFVENWEATQRTQWAQLLRELERRRYGALTFADLFFFGPNGN